MFENRSRAIALYSLTKPSITGVAVTTAIQLRLMGGAIALAIMSTVMNSHIRSRLDPVLTEYQLHTLLQTTGIIEKFPEHVQEIVRETYAGAFKKAMYVAVGFSAVQVPTTLGLWKREQVRLD